MRVAPAIALLTTTVFAMVVVPRKVRFGKKPEYFPVELPLDQQPAHPYSYQSPTAGRPVGELTAAMMWDRKLAAAEAHRRAVELADGRGYLSPLPLWCWPVGGGRRSVVRSACGQE